MAEVMIAGSSSRAKVRNPWAVLGLSLITLGIYPIFWWYYINRELRDLGRARGVSGLGENPGLSTAAWLFGAFGFTLGISLVWTIVTTSQRIQRAGRVVDLPDQLNGWIAGLLWIFTLSLGGFVYTQHELNKVWQTQPAVPPVPPSLPSESPATADLGPSSAEAPKQPPSGAPPTEGSPPS